MPICVSWRVAHMSVKQAMNMCVITIYDITIYDITIYDITKINRP